MASDISEDDGGYPWLSWALTGILTLAGVIVVGLVISVRNPRSQYGDGAEGNRGRGETGGSSAGIHGLSPLSPGNPSARRGSVTA